jgi:hypothetical protein
MNAVDLARWQFGITGQPPDLGGHPAGPALNWLRQHGWQTHPGLLCPAHAH